MSENIDEKLGQLLREDAPSPRDALFRLSVLQRSERQRFRRRSIVILAAALVLVAIVWIGFNAGLDLIAIAALALLCAGLAVSVFFSVPGVALLIRRLRGASGKN
jgi:ammonia channel protein AmtB